MHSWKPERKERNMTIRVFITLHLATLLLTAWYYGIFLHAASGLNREPLRGGNYRRSSVTKLCITSRARCYITGRGELIG